MYSPSLIVTLELEAGAQLYFNDLRKAHFPAYSNYLDAHLTLFHKLPSNLPFITESLEDFAKIPPIALEVNDISNFGMGVAYNLSSGILQQLHAQMQETFRPWLIRQDQHRLRPHITIQNKVTAFKAQRLQEELLHGFEPFTIQTTGFATWYYLGGPWKAAGSFPFIPYAGG